MKKRAEFFWTYYKGYVLAAILILSAVIYLVSVFSEGREENTYSILVINNYMGSEEKETLSNMVSERVNVSKELIMIDDSVQLSLEDGRKLAVSGGPEKITTEYFACALDVMIAPKEIVAYYSKLGGLKELSDLPDSRLSGMEPESLWTEGKDGTDGVYALSVKGSCFEELFDEENMYLCIFINSMHQQQNEVLLRSFLP